MSTRNPKASRRFGSLIWVAGLTLSAIRCAPIIPNVGDPGVPNGYPIESVRLEGVESVDEGELSSGLANRPPSGLFRKTYYRWDELQVELDRKRIKSFYERRGFFDVEVEGPTVERVGAEYNRNVVVWKIREGEPTRIREVYLSGAPEGFEARLRAVMEINPGEVYSTASFESAQLRLHALLVRKGYARAEVKGRVQIDRQRGEAKVIFDLFPGPLVRLYDLVAVGTVRTPTSAVLVRKTWKNGDVFDPVELDQLRQRLYAIDQYSGVRLDFAAEGDDDARARVIARVDEADQNELQVGVGGAFDPANYYIRARARYKRRNFPLSLTNSTLEFIPALQFLRSGGGLENAEFTPQIRASVIWYDFIFPRFQLETDGGFRYQQLEAFEWFGPDIGQTLSRPVLNDRITAALGWRFTRYSYADPRVEGPGDPDAGMVVGPTAQEILNIDASQSVVTVRPAFTYEGRNDILEPTRGLYAQVALDFGVATGADSAGFLLFHPELRHYLPFWDERLVVASRVNFVTNLQGQLPAPLRLYAGGASSQRGFPQRRLSQPGGFLVDRTLRGTGTGLFVPSNGARVQEDGQDVQLPIGGETLIEMNFETRIRIVKLFGFWLGVVAFLDAADIGNRIEDLSFPLHFAAGGGLRYLTPIGAVRFDLGYRLNRTDDAFSPCQGFECTAFHFSLGQAF